jgi:hypothetical protein
VKEKENIALQLLHDTLSKRIQKNIHRDVEVDYDSVHQ